MSVVVNNSASALVMSTSQISDRVLFGFNAFIRIADRGFLIELGLSIINIPVLSVAS